MRNVRDITDARAALVKLDRDDPNGRMSRKLVEDGAKPIPLDSEESRASGLGFVARVILDEPGVVQRIRDNGFNARVGGKKLDQNPHRESGKYTWWREGWFAADSNL